MSRGEWVPPDLRRVGHRNDLVALRAWHVGDLSTIREAGEDPYIPLVTSVPRTYTLAAGRAWLRRQEDQAAEGRGCPMAVTAVADGRVVGMATITGIDWEHRRANVGYWILARHRGLGFAKAAVSLLPDIAGQLGLVRLQALVEPDNLASQAVCRALGFVAEGTLSSYYRVAGRNRDMTMFALVLREADPG